MQVIFVEPLGFSSSSLCQESLDIGIFRSPEHFIRTFKNNLAVTKQQESGVGDTEIRAFAPERYTATSIESVLRSQREGITHAMRDEDAGNVVDITQRDDELVDFSG